MHRLHKVAIALAIVCAILAGVIVFRASGEGELGPGSRHWPRGTVHRFRVDWHTEAAAAIASKNDATVGSEIELRGVLAIRSYGGRENRALVVARIEKLEALRVSALGKDLLAGVDQSKDFIGQDALVDLDSGGHVIEIRFAEGSIPLFRHVMRSLVLEALSIAANENTDGGVATALGRAKQRSRPDPKDPKRIAVIRAGYDELEAFPEGLGDDAEQEIAASAEMKLGADDTIQGIQSDEELVVRQGGYVSGFHSTSKLELTSIGITKIELGKPPLMTQSVPGLSSGTSDADRRASLERRSAGVTLESVLSDARVHAFVPRGGSTEWIWRDSAFLELHPELSVEIVKRSAGDTFDLAGRAAVFDLLVIAGTAQGQAALVGALSTWVKNDAEAYTVLVQRLGHLAVPTPETAAFVLAELDANDGKQPLRFRACAYTLGAIAGTTATDDAARARKLTDRLVLALDQAKEPEDRVALLRGIGNAGFDDDFSAILPYAVDDVAEVRTAVAAAMRKMEGEKVELALLALVVDAEPLVARAAISSLLRQEMRESSWNGLRKAVEDGSIQEEAHGVLVNELASRHETSPHASAVLVAMLASPHTLPVVKPQIEALLRK